MLDLAVFRLRVLRPREGQEQGFMGRPYLDTSPSQVLHAAIVEKPALETATGALWTVGNVQPLDDHGLYFCLGRVKKATREVFAEGEFRQELAQQAPFTHVVCDTALEACAIARRSDLAPNPHQLATRLVRVLAQAMVVQEGRYELETTELDDPQRFLEYLATAHEVSSFWMTYSRPNPWNAAEDFIGPFTRAVEHTGGKKGRTSISGKDLDRESLGEVARSVAGEAYDAGATLRMNKKGRSTRKRLRGNHVSIKNPPLSTDEARKGAIEKLREVFRRITGRT
jgi:hypothetical protein